MVSQPPRTDRTTDDKPHIIVLGAGFGGLKFCKEFKAQARITVIDQHNYHLFQPLLYQVAMAALSSPQVSEPVRSVFRNDPRITVLMDTVQRIDLNQKQVTLNQQTLDYDYLIIGLGGRPNYFGNDHWAKYAPGLKSLTDAMTIRRQVLSSFELAENTADDQERQRLMTMVAVGGGPTGVELSGAMAELSKSVFRRDFRRIDPTHTKIILVHAGARLLEPYPPNLSQKAKQQLESLGVEVRLNLRVSDVCPDHVKLSDGNTIPTRNVLWGAGIKANPVVNTLGLDLGHGGRVPVDTDCSLPNHPEAFAIGDIAQMTDAHGVSVPGVAQGALQTGEHVAKVLDHELNHPNDNRPRPQFTYWDKGSMATIGRKRAVAHIGKHQLSGMPAWLAWLGVHLLFLVSFRDRLSVLGSWIVSYFTFTRGARVIYGTIEQRTRSDSANQPHQAQKEQSEESHCD